MLFRSNNTLVNQHYASSIYTIGFGKHFLFRLCHRDLTSPSSRATGLMPVGITGKWAGLMRVRRSGVTLIELLTVIGVIGLLMALTIPAVMRVRESSRLVECRSHLRQIGVAMQNYHAVHRMFPPGSSSKYSMHVFLLPYVDQAPLYSQVDFVGDGPGGVVARTRVPLYFCPTDPAGGAGSASSYSTNYAGNFGRGVQRYGYDGFFRNLGAVLQFGRGGPIRAASVSDGLSNTVAVSEILVSDGSYHKLRTIWLVTPPRPGGNRLDEFARACESLPLVRDGADHFSRGRPWTYGDIGTTQYNHVLPPNRNSCKNQAHADRSEEHTSELQSRRNRVCRLLLASNNHLCHLLSTYYPTTIT